MRYILALMLVSGAAVCHGIEPGFYGIRDKLAAEAFEVEQKADRVLWFGSDLKCDLGLGKVEDDLRTPIYLSRSEVEDFLKNEKHKAVLVVWCDKTIMWSERKDQLLADVQGFTSRLGYNRVLVLGAHSMGVHVVSDFKPAKAEPGGAANVSQPVRAETNRTSSTAGSRR